MKKLEELGISPSPWKYILYNEHRNGRYIHFGEVWNGDIRKILVDQTQPDARLIAAAPELYEALFEALPWLTDIGEEVVGNECAAKIFAIVKKAKSALAKAAGEGEGE